MSEALIIIDAQRGFMPIEEGERLQVAGFGELPVSGGEQIVPAINQLIANFVTKQALIVTTQDWHPAQTAHFADTPNFITTWPVHCVAGTPGAALHPDIVLPESTHRFVKGTDVLLDGADDTSYSAYYAHTADQSPRTALPELLAQHSVTSVTLAGLALDYCVDKSAQDFRSQLGLEVIVASDATRGIDPATCQAAQETWQTLGIQTLTTHEIITRPQE
jgi:nicotinamidase/pyrazinamidase